MRFLFLIISFYHSVLLASNIGHWPGMVPKDAVRPVALDLVFNGQRLNIDEATTMRERGDDLSQLDPQESDLWAKNNLNFTYGQFEDVSADETLKFESTILSRPGNLRFAVARSTDHENISLSVMLNKNIHNVFLRKALLEKLGYRIPKIQYLPKVNISFENKFELETFLLTMSQDTFGAKERWLLSQDDATHTIVLQDIAIMAAESPVYNLALGAMPSSIIKGRRVLNSLLVAYTLGTSTESINLLNWEAGRIISQSVKFDYEEAEEFTPAWEDARWMARKIATLSRQDFIEIVAKAYLPQNPSVLLVEKLISRRNSILRLLELKLPVIKMNSEISQGERLIKGKLLGEKWHGHAERFSYGDPKTPLSGSEMFQFFKGKVISTVIDNLVQSFNHYVIPRTDVAAKVTEHQIKVFDQNFQDFLRTGVYKPVPFGIYAIPTLSGQLIASRDIIAGTYMGADNLVQLADSIGVAVNLGVHIGTDGISGPWSVNGGAKANLMRRYTHLRPIVSIKEALKTPYKNILVPLLKRNNGRILDDILASKLLPNGNEEELQKKINDVVELFKKELPIGDSFMITDSIIGNVNIGVGLGLSALIQAQLQIFSNQVLLSRLHILRRNKDTIQIYQDLGGVAGVGINFGINAIVPILRISVEAQKGKTKTKFFQVNINGELKENPDLLKNLLALRSVFIHNDLELVKELQKPYVIDHHYNLAQSQFKFLFWRLSGRTIGDIVSVTHPLGAQKHFVKYSVGKRSGRDYQAMVSEVLNGVISYYANVPLGLMNEGNGNPGDTFMGKSKTLEINFEAEIDKPQMNGALITRPFLNISKRWKGWSISAKRAQKILDKINRDMEHRIVSPFALGSTEKLQLYTINLDMNFYSNAIVASMTKNKTELISVFNAYAEYQDINQAIYMPGDRLSGSSFLEEYTKQDQIRDGVAKVLNYQKKYHKYIEDGEVDKAAKYAAKLFSVLHQDLSFTGLALICGGKENLYVTAQIRGFRKGDENGDVPYISDSLGEFGDINISGPMNSMKSKIGMTDAEFYASWMMGVF